MHKCACQQLDKCDHNDNERTIEGTWVSLEIKKAIDMGYKIIKISEVWHWDSASQYNSLTKIGGLFTKFINTAHKEKQEACGYPSYAKTDEEKNKYIYNYFDNEGILLVKNKINKKSEKDLSQN